MSANFDGSWAFSADLKPKKNTEHVNDRKNNKKTSNQEQISEKEEQTKQGKNKSKLALLLRTIKDQSEWTLLVNNKRKNIQRLRMEDLYIGNVTDDTTDEEILLTLLGLDSTAYLREKSLLRMQQYTDNGRFAGYIHVRIPQHL